MLPFWQKPRVMFILKRCLHHASLWRNFPQYWRMCFRSLWGHVCLWKLWRVCMKKSRWIALNVSRGTKTKNITKCAMFKKGITRILLFQENLAPVIQICHQDGSTGISGFFHKSIIRIQELEALAKENALYYRHRFSFYSFVSFLPSFYFRLRIADWRV